MEVMGKKHYWGPIRRGWGVVQVSPILLITVICFPNFYVRYPRISCLRSRIQIIFPQNTPYPYNFLPKYPVSQWSPLGPHYCFSFQSNFCLLFSHYISGKRLLHQRRNFLFPLPCCPSYINWSLVISKEKLERFVLHCSFDFVTMLLSIHWLQAK